jgi:hypothetical protein
LTYKQILRWLDELAVAPRRKRTGKDEVERFHDEPVNEEKKRSRKMSANRVWAILRAALNLAANNHELSKEAWSRIKSFGKVGKVRVRFLDDSLGEQVRLVNACEPDFRDLVRGALLTGGALW